ncbi:uncharacterized protein SPSK_10216 [Sporothrix schenckii 1099-18]|uniref:Uncharacterized protein n=1 Tax=Sporothrix schenckii 1099-18 TaxID=1397361 RepID=A0A0F2M6Y8_SPOSC|nr:uncharacterized protein SPSK_10216 [Sporothrix schenckii 1099-18]KJR84575.1 hypothetical protein SPSK_10216 [Sporothrix schenckii 1099-18]
MTTGAGPRDALSQPPFRNGNMPMATLEEDPIYTSCNVITQNASSASTPPGNALKTPEAARPALAQRAGHSA